MSEVDERPRDAGPQRPARSARWEVPEVLAGVLGAGVLVACLCSVASALWGAWVVEYASYGVGSFARPQTLMTAGGYTDVGVVLLLVAAVVLWWHAGVLFDRGVEGDPTPVAQATVVRRLVLALDGLVIVTGIFALLGIVGAVQLNADLGGPDVRWMVLGEIGTAAAAIAGCIGAHYALRRAHADAVLLDVVLPVDGVDEGGVDSHGAE